MTVSFVFKSPAPDEAAETRRIDAAKESLSPFGAVSTMAVVGKHGPETALRLEEARPVPQNLLDAHTLEETGINWQDWQPFGRQFFLLPRDRISPPSQHGIDSRQIKTSRLANGVLHVLRGVAGRF